MPNATIQRYLAWIAGIGLFAACFGCNLAVQNQMRASTVFLIASWFILVPLFLYLVRTRRRIKRVIRTKTAQRTEQRQEELDALGQAFGPATDEGRKTKSG